MPCIVVTIWQFEKGKTRNNEKKKAVATRNQDGEQ